MSQLVTLQIPDELYERVQQAAEVSERPLETVLLESIDVLFGALTEPAEVERLLKEMQRYSDAQLWAVVHRRLPWNQSLRLRELSAKNKQGTLVSAEESELNRLIELVDGYMLVRSEALVLLNEERLA